MLATLQVEKHGVRPSGRSRWARDGQILELLERLYLTLDFGMSEDEFVVGDREVWADLCYLLALRYK